MSAPRVNPEALAVVLKELRAQGPEPLYYAFCCGRAYLGRLKPSRCSTCPKVPEPIELTETTDLAQLPGVKDTAP